MSSRHNRRKKTRETTRKANVRKLQTAASKAVTDTDKMNWNRLARLFEDCLNMYQPIHQLTPILTTPLFRKKASEEDCKQIMDAVRQLTGHVQATLGELHDIRKKHFGRTGPVKGEKRTMEAIEIGMDYQNWVTKFNATVIVLSMEISGQIEQIMAPEESAAAAVSSEPLFSDIDVTATEAESTSQPETTNHDE